MYSTISNVHYLECESISKNYKNILFLTSVQKYFDNEKSGARE